MIGGGRRRGTSRVLATALVLCATSFAASTTAASATTAASTTAAGGVPAPGVRPAVSSADAPTGPQQRAREVVAGMSVAEQASSVVMGHVAGTDPAALGSYLRPGFGGFILMGGNIPDTDAELAALTAAMTDGHPVPPLIAIDQEGGLVSRLDGDVFPASRDLKERPVEDTRLAFGARGSLVARSGITANYGTVADVTSDTGSFIYGRALGADPRRAAERVAAATSAQEPFLASTLKHFPGHGAAPGDSHRAIPRSEKSLAEWRTSDAVPFEAGIRAGASLLMYGHLAYPAVDERPASLSSRWHEIAREELGFEGVAVTDDLGMLLSSGDPAYADPVANGVAALAAGNDLVLMIAGSDAATAGRMAAGIAAAVDTGALPADRLSEAATRVMELRLRMSAATARWTVCDDCEPAG